MKQIIINSEELQTRVAVVHDGRLHDFFMERKDRDRIVGSIYKGKIKNLEPSLQAAFVDIGCGKNAFLHYWDMLPATQEMLEDEEEDGEDAVEMTLDSIPEHNLESEEPKSEKRRHHHVHHRRSNSKPAGDDSSADAGASPSPDTQGKRPELLPLCHPGQQPKGQTQNQRRRQNERGRQPAPAELAAAAEPKSGGFISKLIRKLFPKSEKQEGAKAKEPSAKAEKRPQIVSLLDGTPQTAQPKPQAQANGKKQNGGQEKPAPKPQEKKIQPLQARKPEKAKKAGPTIEDIPNLFHVDQEILVQVTKGPIGTKGARVTTNLSIPGRYLVLLPNACHIGVSRRVEERAERDRLRKMLKAMPIPKNMGVICRTVGKGVKEEYFQRDLDLLLDSWRRGEEQAKSKTGLVCVYQEPDLAERTLRDCLTSDINEIITDSEETYACATKLLAAYCSNSDIKVKLYTSPVPVFDKYGISPQIDAIFNRKVNLPSGGYICIDETEALIAIDVNSGKNRAGKDQPETILTTNLEAVQEIARQLRLRNIGGLVVLDLIDMRSKKDQQLVYKTLKDCLEEDRAHIKTYPISPLGLLEMTRQREDASLESTFYDACPYCKGRGLIKSVTTMSVEIQRRMNEILGRRSTIQQLTVTVHPKILERLRTEDRKLMDTMASDFNRKLTFCADSKLHMEEFHITDENGKEF